MPLKKRHILPVFIPFMGCKNRCIYCNQHAITNVAPVDILSSVEEQIVRWTKTETQWDEVAFYGGTFGNLPENLRHKLYEMAYPYAIRYSTCPESITPCLTGEMISYNVGTVELGVQSLSEKVLKMNGRFYGLGDVSQAFSLIPQGIKKACQLMVGMYGETQADVALTAKGLASLNADYIRIYPTVILKKTLLEKYFHDGQFQPLSAEDILLRTAWLYIHGETDTSHVIRIGLPPEVSESAMLAGGWWHPACGDLVQTLVINCWLTLNKEKNIPFHPSLYGYKAVLRERFAGLDLHETPRADTMKTITKTVREHYLEDKQWFTERENIDFAQRLARTADIR